MWKKPVPSSESPSRSQPPETPKRPAPAPTSVSTATARIGPSLVVKGEIHGEEDLFVEGKVEGSITVKGGSVTVGETGRVQADIRAVSIQVAGQVTGNLSGAERVILLKSGRVEGNIAAKNVTLENGCRFKGSIDMESARPGAVTELTAPNASAKPNGGGGVTHGPVRTS